MHCEVPHHGLRLMVNNVKLWNGGVLIRNPDGLEPRIAVNEACCCWCPEDCSECCDFAGVLDGLPADYDFWNGDYAVDRTNCVWSGTRFCFGGDPGCGVWYGDLLISIRCTDVLPWEIEVTGDFAQLNGPGFVTPIWTANAGAAACPAEGVYTLQPANADATDIGPITLELTCI